MRTCVHHGDSVTTAAGEEAYICTAPTRFLGYSCLPGSPCGTVGDCFVPLPAAAEEPAPLMSCGHPRSDLRGHDEATSYCAGCERESREPDPVPDSTPVTFADVLRYHRQRAADWRSADRPWHEEAVECLRILALEAAEGCISACETESVAGCSEESCPIWQARKAVEVET